MGWRRGEQAVRCWREKVLTLLTGIDLVTTGTAAAVKQLQRDVEEIARRMVALQRSEAASNTALAQGLEEIATELATAGLPQAKIDATMATIRGNLAKLRAAMPPAAATT